MQGAETQQVLEDMSGRIYPLQFMHVGKLHDVPVPLVRVSSCGGLQLEVLQEIINTDPPQGNYHLVSLQQRPKGSSTGLTLLKMLVSRPEHYASKDWLTEHLTRVRSRDDDDEEGWGRGLVRVDNVVYLLRSLLCPPGIDGEDILRKMLVVYVKNHRDSGPGYQLATTPLLWLDVDVIAALVQEACLCEQDGRDALSVWEQVYALAVKGCYLPHEAYSDWAADKRAEIDGYLKQSVLALRRLLLVRYGKAGEDRVLMLLRSYWQTHPTDEDVLRPLMELLGEWDCVQEALDYYYRLCELLKEDGREPTRRTQQTMQDVTARKQPKLVQGLPSTRKQEVLVSGEIDGIQIMSTTHQLQQADSVALDITLLNHVLSEGGFCSTCSDGLYVDGSWANSLRILLVEQIALLMSSLELGANGMAHDVAKRETLRRIIATLSLLTTEQVAIINPEPWERLVKARVQRVALNEETLNHFERLLGICWELVDTQALDVAESVLSSFLSKILTIPQKEGRIAILASHGLRLWSILTHHRLDLAQKVWLCEQSVDYAHRADDPNSLVPALIELAGAYEYTNQSEKRFKVLQEALYHSAHASPFVQSRAYSRNAVVLAENGRKQEAQFYIGLAQEVFPDNPKKDPGFLFADSSIFRLSYHAGLVHILTGKAAQADAAFELYKQHPSGSHIPERIRLEIANGQSKAAILINDAERYATLLEEVIIGSANIGSKKRLDEACHIFREQMPAAWLTHPRIQTLTEKYRLKREE
jgi:tetratricopeptide (TPR) repeat protein